PLRSLVCIRRVAHQVLNDDRELAAITPELDPSLEFRLHRDVTLLELAFDEMDRALDLVDGIEVLEGFLFDASLPLDGAHELADAPRRFFGELEGLEQVESDPDVVRWSHFGVRGGVAVLFGVGDRQLEAV